MAEDLEVAGQIRVIVDRRPTYGYRRITSLLNKARRATGLSAVNHKRVYRLMKINSWLLTRHTARVQGRAHDGKVIVMTSNIRWCSDAFEITCWNGDKVRVVFTLDACDREIISWGASGETGVSGAMVRDMMLEAVERRFSAIHTPHTIEYLTDNGSCYIAKETRDFALSLGLKPCFTPVRSPESNGMAESFVKTFKRDYASINPLPDKETVIQSLHRWFEDYNENHPHSGLKWQSPRDFIKARN